MAGSFVEAVMIASCEAGLCSECPAVADALLEVMHLDNEQSHDDERGDAELEDLYATLPPGVAYFLKKRDMVCGGTDLREGRQLLRAHFADDQLSHIRQLETITAIKPCSGTKLTAELEPLQLSEKGQDLVQGMREFAKFLLKTIGEEFVVPKVRCELEVNRNREVLLALDTSINKD